MTHWIQVSSGRGPAECCWVAARVADQILMAAKSNGIKAEMIHAVPGPKPKTVKSLLISIEDNINIQHFLSGWKGTVQWIGKSPFRAACKRKNWFVGVDALTPPIEKEMENKHEIKFEVMRSSGPGGQHTNKRESAVRARHVPSGTIAMAREERSQYLNKKLALSRLVNLLEEKKINKRTAYRQEQWRRHNQLERGNAVKVFLGKNFKEAVTANQ